MRASNSVRICVPICERTVAAFGRAGARVAEAGDLIELRLDCLDGSELERAMQGMEALLNSFTLPKIVTLRPSEQGGHRDLDDQARDQLWCMGAQLAGAEFMDLELDIVERLSSSENSISRSLDWGKVICSHHDFAGVPSDIDEIYERMARTPARILKIAVQAADVTDCIPVFRLLERAKGEGREIIGIAMGSAGIMTRVLGPSRGAFLTYGSGDNESATAPGQITAGELRSLYRIHKIDRHTQILGLVGSPVAHSLSPQIHNAAFECTDLNAVYLPFDVQDIASFMQRLIHPRTREIDLNIRGLSVTTPHKAAVLSYLDSVDPAAEKIGAVNTIVVSDEGLQGYNTDAGAFIKTLVQKVGELKNARCAIVGAGGAASAAVWGLTQKDADVTVFARDIEKASLLAERFGVISEQLSAACFAGFDVVINATILGTSGRHEAHTPATAEQLRGARLAYDLVYNPGQTRFLNEAHEAGCETLGGLPMLVAQAGEQFKLWTGADAPEPVMRAAAVRALGHNV